MEWNKGRRKWNPGRRKEDSAIGYETLFLFLPEVCLSQHYPRLNPVPANFFFYSSLHFLRHTLYIYIYHTRTQHKLSNPPGNILHWSMMPFQVLSLSLGPIPATVPYSLIPLVC
ncbi:Hypothetical predicted protein [Podarcis lilfordi]|uniref:Uncharacterized protein n=1 Tax=Podarcis lilfordi TaxID=74358 RepID=A0AA35KJJ7_9SAUR|nr:Hypothetical predicted protein [Podarcis lilfordi]